jgi:hypothetical protein
MEKNNIYKDKNKLSLEFSGNILRNLIRISDFVEKL